MISRRHSFRSTTAFVLEARPTHETENVKETLLSRIAGTLGAVVEAGIDLDDDGGGDDRDADREQNNAIEDVFAAMREAVSPRAAPEPAASNANALHRASTRVMRRTQSLSVAAEISDCPLTCSVAAIVESTPRRLVAIQAADAKVNASRIWTTLCCIAMLERMNVSWIWGDGDLYPREERTIVDGAREWVEACAAKSPALAELLATGAMQKRASSVTQLWRRACDQRVAELRRSKAIRARMTKSHAHRRVHAVRPVALLSDLRCTGR